MCECECVQGDQKQNKKKNRSVEKEKSLYQNLLEFVWKYGCTVASSLEISIYIDLITTHLTSLRMERTVQRVFTELLLNRWITQAWPYTGNYGCSVNRLTKPYYKDYFNHVKTLSSVGGTASFPINPLLTSCFISKESSQGSLIQMSICMNSFFKAPVSLKKKKKLPMLFIFSTC